MGEVCLYTFGIHQYYYYLCHFLYLLLLEQVGLSTLIYMPVQWTLQITDTFNWYIGLCPSFGYVVAIWNIIATS